MLKIKVTEKSGASIEYVGEQSLVARLHEMGHGKPERWQPASEAHDIADVLETEQREVQAAEGEQPAVMQDWVKLRAEYTVEIVDITAQLEQERINREALEYLASTDWLIIRELDAGVACPAEIKQARAEARARIVR